jgi:hypothetical protein
MHLRILKRIRVNVVVLFGILLLVDNNRFFICGGGFFCFVPVILRVLISGFVYSIDYDEVNKQCLSKELKIKYGCVAR